MWAGCVQTFEDLSDLPKDRGEGVLQNHGNRITLWVARDVRRSLAQLLPKAGRLGVPYMPRWTGRSSRDKLLLSVCGSGSTDAGICIFCRYPELQISAKRLHRQPCQARLRNRFISQWILFIPHEHSLLNDISICWALWQFNNKF